MKKILILAATALALAACDNNEDNPVTSPVAAKVTATIGESTLTRTIDNSWTPNDKIGISSTLLNKDKKPVPGPYINLEYTTQGDGLFTGTDIFFYKPMTLTAYYPFTDTPGTNGTISATTDADAQKNLPSIDFLWDSKTGVDKKDFSASNPNVNFIFAHKMSKLTFTFKSSEPSFDDDGIKISDGVDVRTMISYKIEGLGIEGTFNTATGECAIDEAKGRQGLTINFEKETITIDEEDKYNYERPFSPLIVFPQKKPDDKNFILHITTDELTEGDPTQNYKCALQFTNDEIKPGNHYHFTIQVTRRGLIVGKLTIEPWIESKKFY